MNAKSNAFRIHPQNTEPVAEVVKRRALLAGRSTRVRLVVHTIIHWGHWGAGGGGLEEKLLNTIGAVSGVQIVETVENGLFRILNACPRLQIVSRVADLTLSNLVGFNLQTILHSCILTHRKSVVRKLLGSHNAREPEEGRGTLGTLEVKESVEVVVLVKNVSWLALQTLVLRRHCTVLSRSDSGTGLLVLTELEADKTSFAEQFVLGVSHAVFNDSDQFLAFSVLQLTSVVTSLALFQIDVLHALVDQSFGVDATALLLLNGVGFGVAGFAVSELVVDLAEVDLVHHTRARLEEVEVSQIT